MPLTPDESFMKEALRLAARGRGRTSPNPLVGAVVVHDGRMVGRGFHEFVGGPHAEVNALGEAGDLARGATLYVTLEPCNHHGRTPPCSEAVLAAGISRVVIGMADPNPGVKGGGAAFLESRGVETTTGVMEGPCRLLNQPFIKHVTSGRPYVVLKGAVTLDGRLATKTGDSRWISNERSRRFVHQLRCDMDAILVGVETALQDDPQLTARIRRRPPCRQPLRIVLDAGLRLPVESRLVHTAKEVPVWVACGEEASFERERALTQQGVTVRRFSAPEGRIDLDALLLELGRQSVNSLLVEGGSRVFGAILEAGLADEFLFFYAPKILGDPDGVPLVAGPPRPLMAQATPVFDVRVRRFGQDVLLQGRFRQTPY